MASLFLLLGFNNLLILDIFQFINCNLFIKKPALVLPAASLRLAKGTHDELNAVAGFSKVSSREKLIFHLLWPGACSTHSYCLLPLLHPV